MSPHAGPHSHTTSLRVRSTIQAELERTDSGAAVAAKPGLRMAALFLLPLLALGGCMVDTTPLGPPLQLGADESPSTGVAAATCHHGAHEPR